ncbi:MAG: hypothetical protein VB876_15630 [Pirellulales bacterium]
MKATPNQSKSRLPAELEDKLVAYSSALVDQQAARVIVPPQQSANGFWFGGGNLVEDELGNFLLVGRYRNHGDSRTGLGSGERGLELAIFRSTDRAQSFNKILSWSKPELNVDSREVLSIEGAALHLSDRGAELFVSTEKTGIGYPGDLRDYLKPGTGVWTIERLRAPSVDRLKTAPLETVVVSEDPAHLHAKDPAVYRQKNGGLVLLFCTHPYCWSSSNTAYCMRESDGDIFSPPQFEFLPRGTTWDVAITRGTAIVDVPQVGAFKNLHVSLIFYDGGESLRALDEHHSGVRRPRGYSCEEIGGAGYFVDGQLDQIHRLSRYTPQFVSPLGTGCSRYVDVLTTEDACFVTWQQSQHDLSQPLVMNVATRAKLECFLS